MEDDLQSETSGYFRRLLVSQCNAGREEGDDVDDDKAQEEAQAIYDVSIKLLFTTNAQNKRTSPTPLATMAHLPTPL